jgi:hypothetical protein
MTNKKRELHKVLEQERVPAVILFYFSLVSPDFHGPTTKTRSGPSFLKKIVL